MYFTFVNKHDAMYVVDMERAQEDKFKFVQTLHGCVICSGVGLARASCSNGVRKLKVTRPGLAERHVKHHLFR